MAGNPEHGLWVNLPDGTPYCVYAPHPKQLEFHQSDISNLVAIGSRGSGKSLMLRMDAHMRALSEPGCTLILIRKTMKQLEQSHLQEIGAEMQLLGGYYHGTKHCAYYPNGSKLFFSYVGHAGDALNLLSAQFLAAYYDELSVIPWDYFIKLNASVRAAGAQKDRGLKAVIRAATNPLGESAAEVMKYFVYQEVNYEEEDYDPSEWGHVRIDMEDNPDLDIVQYKKRFVNAPEHVKAAWLRGEYMEANTLFTFHPSKEVDGVKRPYHVINELDIDNLVRKARLYRAFDYGYAPDPAYCCWIAHLGHRYIVFHEKKWNKAIISEIAASIKEEDEILGINTDTNSNRVITTFCDPSIDIHTGHDVRTMKGIFEDHGISMECSVNNREHFAAAVHSALAEEAEPNVPRLQIYDGIPGDRPGAKYMIRAIPLQHFDEKHPLRLADQTHDHPVVTLAYFLISTASYEKKTLKDSRVPKWMRPHPTKHNVLGSDGVRSQR